MSVGRFDELSVFWRLYAAVDVALCLAVVMAATAALRAQLQRARL